MDAFRLLVALSVVAAPIAFAEPRGSTPPGMSQDGAKPADGAIKGGTILPGEQSGVPDDGKLRQRCEELTDTLREDCHKQRDNAAGGGTKPPEDEPATEPRTKSPERAD